MKETVTEYETTEVEKTVTDYETTEVEIEQYISDLTGSVIDENDLITLYANPEIKDTSRCGASKYIPYPRTHRFTATNMNLWEKEVYENAKKMILQYILVANYTSLLQSLLG